MKIKLITGIGLFALCFVFMTSCKSSSAQTYKESRIHEKEIHADNFAGSPEEILAYMLRKESGVILTLFSA